MRKWIIRINMPCHHVTRHPRAGIASITIITLLKIVFVYIFMVTVVTTMYLPEITIQKEWERNYRHMSYLYLRGVSKMNSGSLDDSYGNSHIRRIRPIGVPPVLRIHPIIFLTNFIPHRRPFLPRIILTCIIYQ